MGGPSAEAAFTRFLALQAEEAGMDFEEFCRQNADVESGLRELHARWIAEQGGSTSGLGARFDRIQGGIPDTDRYTVRREVARGGMGVILEAWDSTLRRTLAMKAILSNDDGFAPDPDEDSRLRTRFLEEAQITGQLDHPGIVPVHELDADSEGRVFFTMRLVKGRTLDLVIQQAHDGTEGWNLTRAVGVILRVCEAMAFAHSKGVIHRDIKPTNVMVGNFGETYVMDWGLAKVLAPGSGADRRRVESGSVNRTRIDTDRVDVERTPDAPLVTMHGSVVGTPTYMSPEQGAGRHDELDAQSDVYSVGALLYTLLTNRMPYVEPEKFITGQDVLRMLLAGPPRPIHEIDRQLPAELVAVCEKAMARDPRDRYGGMLAMAEDLRAYLERRVVSAYQTGAVAEFRKWVERNRATAAVVVLLVFLAVGGAFLFAWNQRRQVRLVEAAQAETITARDLARANERRALANQERSAANSYLANLVAAAASLRLYESKEAKLRLADCPEARRGWEWHHLATKSDTSLATLRGHEGRIQAVAFHPEGGRIASGGADRTLRIWDVASGEAAFSLEGCTDALTAVAYSADGQRIAATCRDGIVRVWRAETGRLMTSMTGHETAATCVAWSADGARIVSGSTDDTLRVWDATTGQSIAVVEGAVTAVAFDPSGALFASGGGDDLRLWNAREMRELRALTGHDGEISSLAFAPDGGLLAAGSLDGIVRVWETASGSLVALLSGHTDPVSAVAFTEDGTRVVSAALDKTVRIWPARGGSPEVLLGHDEAVLCVAVDQRAARVVAGALDGTLRTWELDGGSAVVTRAVEDEFVTSVDLSPDSRRVVVGATGIGAIRIRDAASGHELRTLEDVESGVTSVAFSPDGARIVAGGEEDSLGRVWDAATGRLLRTLSGHEASITSVAFGDVIATGSADQTIRIWSTPPRVLTGHTGAVRGLAFSPDRRILVSASADGTVRVWEMETGRTLRTHRSAGAAFHAVAFHPEGAMIAAAGDDRTIQLWDADSGETIRTLTGHVAAVAGLAFNPEGDRLASAGHDKTVRIWSVESGEALLRLAGHDGWVKSVAFSRDGALVVSGSFDASIRIWRAR